MSAVLQLVNDPTIVESEEITNASKLALLPSAQSSRDDKQLHELIRILREELARAEHSLASYKVLLANARVRESELRAELINFKH